MTTQVPQPPPQYADPQYAAQQHTPPAATYPTAPPWAAPTPPPTPAEEPLQPYGQLLVPYPEEMHNAGRTGAPSWWPVIPWTLFFGVLGLIPAARRASRARRTRNSTAPYWLTWLITAAIGGFLSYAVVLPYAAAAVGDALEHSRQDRLQHNLVHDGTLKPAGGATPTSAQCDAIGARTAGGDRRYTCLVRFSDDSTGTIDVVADADGTWTVASAR